MVGVAGSNPVVSTSIQHTFFIRDAEECRELAPALEFILAEARAFCVVRSRIACVFQKAASAAFLLFVIPSAGSGQALSSAKDQSPTEHC